ncbi:glycosyltransferase WbuB, partial [candidate division KSB1 bacterium]
MKRAFILMHDYGGYAFPLELSLELARRGHRLLHVYTSSSGSPTAAFPADDANFTSVDIDIPPVRKAQFIRRWQAERAYGRKVADIIRQKKPDVLISADTPLDAQAQIARACGQVNCEFIYWLQDILSMATHSVLSQKFGMAGRCIGRYYHHMEKRLLRSAASVITIAEEFAAILANWGIEDARVSVIPNWAPIATIPQKSKVNSFSLEHGLADRFVVLYAGTMGMKQSPEIVVTAARALLQQQNIVFLVVSDGVGMDYLAEKKASWQLDNLILLPLQPFERLADVLASADAGLVLLDPDAGSFCVPSKVWSIYCSSRAAVLVVPEHNLAARVTKNIEAGIVLSPENSQKLAETILFLQSNPEIRQRMGENGRAYAE